MREVVFVDGMRTPFGKQGGTLKDICGSDLAAMTVKALVAKTGIYEKGGKVLVCGNGGSAADSEHIVGELMKGFLLKRPMDEKTAAEFDAVLGAEAAAPAQPLLHGRME